MIRKVTHKGPWSGLEMHDWYKAGFFSPELLVKKYEDPDYEPLAQLIRRIGNSREPFLVPQIGIPHGPLSTQPGNAWAAQGGITAGAGPSASAQPPFAGSFPSFGTTLTAEQQNALERRKQEEQYLMARQKEHLAQQQILVKQMQMQGQHTMHPHQLQHHSSAHSLHSQPSYGSITSPSGYQPSPTQGPVAGPQVVPGFFDSTFRPAPPAGLAPIASGADVLGNIREEEISGMMNQLNTGRSPHFPYGGVPPQFPQHPPLESAMNVQQIASALNDRARLQREQQELDTIQRLGQGEQLAAQTSMDRLQQFHELRGHAEARQSGDPSIEAFREHGAIANDRSLQHPLLADANRFLESSRAANMAAPTIESVPPSKPLEAMSLTQQVQQAASDQQAPVLSSPWSKIDSVPSHPFPPPQSSSPLPAPAAQRKQNLADALTAESRSQSQTPPVETPSASIAPWAKETVETPKGPFSQGNSGSGS